MLVVGALTASGATVVALGWRTSAAARLARMLLTIAAVALGASLAVLATALVTGDFALVYVADHSRRGASAWYRLAGLWGGMEGSLLLWTALARRGERGGVVAHGRPSHPTHRRRWNGRRRPGEHRGAGPPGRRVRRHHGPHR